MMEGRTRAVFSFFFAKRKGRTKEKGRNRGGVKDRSRRITEDEERLTSPERSLLRVDRGIDQKRRLVDAELSDKIRDTRKNRVTNRRKSDDELFDCQRPICAL